MKYTPDQIADITEREAKGLQALKDLQLTPASALSKTNIGNDIFADQVTCYLADTKYTEPTVPAEGVVSPIQNV